MAWFNNRYRCPCGYAWESEWSCECNDKCPDCNKEIEPDDSEDLTFIIQPMRTVAAHGHLSLESCREEEEAECFALLRSPDEASDDPEYEVIAHCENRVAAETLKTFRAAEPVR